MRDLLLLVLFPVLIYYAIRRPFIGLALWLWTSLVPMQTWAYGAATSIRWNFIFAICTMVGYVFMKNRPQMPLNGVFWAMTGLLLIATLSSTFHQGYGILVWDRWERFFKAYLFFVFVYLIVDKRLHVEALMWACVLSVTATAAKQGAKVLFSGGGHVVYGMSSTFNDNNLSAFATLVCIPLTLFLIYLHKDKLIIRLGLVGAIAISAIFVLGSDSRGGVLGLLVLCAYYFWHSNKKIPIAFLGLVVGAVGLSLMDDSWYERMGTISTASEDGSFMGRVIAWKLSILLAIDSPLFGGGFDAVAYRPTWMALLPNWQLVSFIPSPFPTVSHVAHSIYFQVLGDLGFLGFIWFFSIIFVTYRSFAYLSKQSDAEDWLKNMAFYGLIAIVCFLVAGAALSVAYNEITIMLIAVAAKLKIGHGRQRLATKESAE